MSRLPPARLRRNTQSVNIYSRQWRRSIEKVHTVLCGRYHAKVDRLPTGEELFEHGSTHYSSRLDWNSRDEFFRFTRGRFVVDESRNMRQREIKFDMNKLAIVAADSVGAVQCVSIKKYPDGMFNKAYIMCMDNGQEVVAKVPNPNAGIPHFTTASEVATMDFVRSAYSSR
jgi:hypothetical protein